MQVQEILGLPLEIGLTFLRKTKISVNIVETFAPNNKGEIKDNNKLKDPYIIRIREKDYELLEILVSYF